MQQPKPKQVIKPTKEDLALAKRTGVSIEDVMAQGGATPASVIRQIQKDRAYDVRYTPVGLYKKTVKKIKK